MSKLTAIELTEADHAAVASAARQLKSRYRDFCEYEDIQQELYIWLLHHYDKVEEWRATFHERTAERYTVKSLRNAGEKICRREKASQSGYEVDDEFFYSIPMVADMLQLYFDPDWMAPTVDVTHESDKRPPQEGGNLVAMLADVGMAYEAMPLFDRELLRRIYDGGTPVRDAIAYEASGAGIAHDAMDKRIRRVIGRLRQKLGGPAPYTEPDE